MSIKDYEFSDSEVTVELSEDGCLWLCATAYSSINKRDAIAIAKYFKLTSHDIDCQEFKALQTYSDSADLEHYDEVVEIQANINNTSKRVN